MEKPMKRVTILAPYNTMATTIFGPMDILNQAGRLWNQEIDRTDLIIISSATYIEKILELNPELIPWLQHHFDQGAHIASICTGVFLLAETGLLDDKSATLHWGFAELFRKKYPRVKLDQDQMYLDHGRLYCSAGVNAGMDLSLYIVEKFCGRQAAVESAKTMVLDLGRKKQTPYDCSLSTKNHGDPLIVKAQEWIEQHQTKAIDYEWLAREFRMFKQAVGTTPLGYLQKLRVEHAKHLLEDGTRTFNEITYQVGYEDISFFRKIFIRLTGLRPKEYQQRFTGYTDTVVTQ